MDEVDVLIVEDEDEWVDIVTEDAESIGATFVVARDLDEALAAVDQRRFNAITIDMALDGSRTNRDGEKLVRVMDGISEGTQLAVLSGSTQPGLASRLAMVFSVPLILKHSDEPDDLPEILDRMIRAGRSARQRPVDAQMWLRGDMSGVDWEIMLTRAVHNVRGGVPYLNRWMASSLARFTPVLSRADSPSLVAREGYLEGTFWSRRMGAAINVVFGDTESIDNHFLKQYNQRQRMERQLSRRDKGGLTSLVDRGDDDRERFPSLVWIPDDDDHSDWIADVFGTPASD